MQKNESSTHNALAAPTAAISAGSGSHNSCIAGLLEAEWAGLDMTLTHSKTCNLLNIPTGGTVGSCGIPWKPIPLCL